MILKCCPLGFSPLVAIQNKKIYFGPYPDIQRTIPHHVLLSTWFLSDEYRIVSEFPFKTSTNQKFSKPCSTASFPGQTIILSYLKFSAF